MTQEASPTGALRTAEATDAPAPDASQHPDDTGAGERREANLQDRQGEEAQDNPASPNKEAARYRTRLRATETERDRLAELVTGYQRSEIARQAGEHLAVADDLFTVGGHQVADFLTEEGTVDREAVQRATDQLLTDRPGLSARPQMWPDSGRGNPTPASAAPTTWAKFLGN